MIHNGLRNKACFQTGICLTQSFLFCIPSPALIYLSVLVTEHMRLSPAPGCHLLFLQLDVLFLSWQADRSSVLITDPIPKVIREGIKPSSTSSKAWLLRGAHPCSEEPVSAHRTASGCVLSNPHSCSFFSSLLETCHWSGLGKPGNKTWRLLYLTKLYCFEVEHIQIWH